MNSRVINHLVYITLCLGGCMHKRPNPKMGWPVSPAFNGLNKRREITV